MEQINLKMLKSLFQRSADVIFQQYNFQQYTVHLITCDAMVNEQILQTVVVQRVQSLLSNVTEDMLEEEIEQHLHIPYYKRFYRKRMR